MTKASAWLQPYLIKGTTKLFECWVLCDECPDNVYGETVVEKHSDEEITVCGTCWCSDLKEKECPHLIGMQADLNGGHSLWIECDSEGWKEQ